MNNALRIGCGIVVGLVGLYWVAGRSLGELTGYLRASADGTVAHVEEQLPQDMHDRKLSHDLTVLRKEVSERHVHLSQSKTQIAQRGDDVAKLESSLEARKRLLAKAYPILESAERDGLTKVRFAISDYPLAGFQRELDDLMAMQDAESKQLESKKNGLARLEKSDKEAELASAEMRRALEGAEHEETVLKSRRN